MASSKVSAEYAIGIEVGEHDGVGLGGVHVVAHDQLARRGRSRASGPVRRSSPTTYSRRR